MRVVITGTGRSGSWQIRAVQLGAAIGADVIPEARSEQLCGADVVIGVKRIPESTLAAIKRSGANFVWDVVDAWPQRAGDIWSRERALEWARGEIRRISANTIIWPNERMRDDLGIDGPVLKHHCMPDQPINPIRPSVRAVGYQGATRYLDSALVQDISAACKRVGAAFVVNPRQLADVDVCLALRGVEWSSYPQSNWKPATKLTNAHATGTPWIGNRERGYEEISVGAERYVNCGTELTSALLDLADHHDRKSVQAKFLSAAYTLSDAAADMRRMLCALKF